MKLPSRVFAGISLLVLAALACQAVPLSRSPEPNSSNPAAPAAATQQTISMPPPVDLFAAQDTLVGLYEQVNTGVVSIRVLTDSGEGLGSGFVYDREGHIITNYHVVENQTHLEVAFPSGFKARGEVAGSDLDSDLAVLLVDAPPEELSPIPLGDSDQVKVGQMVVAIGNPFGLQGTLTLGVVSGLGRTMQSLHVTSDGGAFTAGDIIQTDTAINPGNSGGPLLNLSGEVIGVNQAIRTNSFSETGEPVNSGVGFAISINTVKRVIDSLIADGHYEYPYLGIFSTNDLSLLDQEALGLSQSTGVYVTSVDPGGPADDAGLLGGESNSSIPGLPAGGDLIVAVDGRPVMTFNDLIGYVIQHKSPGDAVTLTVLRGDEEIELDLVLDRRPAP